MAEQPVRAAPLIDLPGVSREEYGPDHASHLLEQYRLYVQMADRISDRRQQANSFSLTLNTGLIALLGLTWPQTHEAVRPIWFVIVGLAGITLCIAWKVLLTSYRNLNTAKFTVIHAIEEQLPIRPYDAEWTAVGRGGDPGKYRPFTHVEGKIPWVFGALHLALIVVALTT